MDTTLSQRARWAGNQPISHLMHLALARPELISLAAGFVDAATLPIEPTRAAVEAVLADAASGRAALQYGTTPGYGPLREQLLARLAADDGQNSTAGATIDQIVVTAGSNQLLHLIGEMLFDPGDIVLCAAPSYFVYLGMMANLGARRIGVATDEQGMIPAALDAELARLAKSGELSRVRAIYVTSYFDNPSGITLPVERRRQIVEIAERWSRTSKLWVIEDAAYRELRFEGPGLPSLRSFDTTGETVIHTATFSKSYSPGIRVGWGLLPKSLVGPLCELKGNIDFGSPNFSQHVIERVLALGLYEPHVARLREGYRVKRDAMLAAAAEHLSPLKGVSWLRPTGGLYVWLRLPESLDAGDSGPLLARALERGMLYVPGEYCYPTEGEKVCKNTIRLSFGVQSPEKIRQGIAALAQAIAECSQ